MSGRSIYAHGKHNASAFIMSCVHKAFRDQALHRRWLPADQLRMYMHMKYEIGEDIQFSLSAMMRAVNKVLPTMSSVPNVVEFPGGSRLQVFRHSFQNRTRRHFFWVTAQVGVIPSLPSPRNATAWEEDCVLTRLLSGGREKPLVLSMAHDEDEPMPKRQRKGSSTAVADQASTTPTPPSTFSQQSTSSGALSLSTATNDWWKSGDARWLFAPASSAKPYNADCCVKTIVMERIELLESVNRAARNWTFIIEKSVGSPSSESHRYSEADVFALRYRSMYLAIALKQFALHVTGDMQTQWTWKRSLQYAIKVMNDVGVEFYSSFSTLSRCWHRKLARNGYFFYNAPDAKKHGCPRFFVDNPDAMEAFKKHGIANIKDLRVELMLEYVHSELIPKLMMKRKGSLFDDNGDDEGHVGLEEVAPTTKKAFLQSYGLSTLSISTMARWIHACGFRYKKREKHYFVDGHERPETLAYRPVFTKKYIDDEIRAHRWLQMTLEESRELELNKQIATNCGYNYVVDDVDMAEYHVDTSYAFDERIALLPFGGNLSVRKPIDSKTVIFVGQDEAIFKQFLFLTKMWVGPNGERPLLPKDEGSGTMISAFVCREHGLIRVIPPEILTEVNSQRLGKCYADPDAAIEILGSADKQPLPPDKSPFLVLFEYGENREGYWAYNNMVVQFEDAVDVLQVMHPSYDFVFLFDHSAGHAKQRPDGLNQHRMNLSFGGKTPPMRDTVIAQEHGYLGDFPRIVEPGDIQSLGYSQSDSGPFWMSNAQRQESRLDIQLGTTSDVQLKMPEMIEQLISAGVTNTAGKNTRQLKDLCNQSGIPTFTTVLNSIQRNRSELELDLRGKGVTTKGKNKRELVELCGQHNITVMKTVEKVKEGWEGKAKGLLQVLWERGLIDGNNLKQYSLTGKKDDLVGTVDDSTSLRHIMGMCHDFMNEEGMLQHIAKSIGVKVLLTPKCHAELAGEGVEYVWACAKGAYRNLSLQEKKTNKPKLIIGLSPSRDRTDSGEYPFPAATGQREIVLTHYLCTSEFRTLRDGES